MLTTLFYLDQGQGGAQGLEDGVALGLVLSGAEPDDVVERIAIYEQVRRNRASAIQTLSNAGQDQVHLIHKEAAKYMGSESAVPSKSITSLYFINAKCDYSCTSW